MTWIAAMLCGLALPIFAQTPLAFTIDDVPRGSFLARNGHQTPLLDTLEALGVPADIFVNEGQVYQGDDPVARFRVFARWVASPLIGVHNHGFSHQRYSAIGLADYVPDIVRGAHLTRELSLRNKKKPVFFRFPYNDLGSDSTQYHQMRRALDSLGYRIAPFTVESADWMWNALYRHHLEQGDTTAARGVGEEYVAQTLRVLHHFDSLGRAQYGRRVAQIYLCHDNELNADYAGTLIRAFQARDYQIVSLDEATRDPIYAQPDVYYQKWGISWFYRWMTDAAERKRLLRAEPWPESLEVRFKALE